ncbi:MAG: hypothetical protein ACREJ3_13985, partial [Polyangiaceae bacterium]
GGCPMAGAHMTAKEMEHARHMGLADHRGTVAAPSRPALGFALDATTLADVHAWADRAGVDCKDKHPGLVVCAGVNPGTMGLDPAEGTIDELALGFNTRGLLVNETTFRSHLSPQVAASAARDIVSSLVAKLGPAKESAGAFDAARLSSPSATSISTVSYLYRDYVAEVSAMNLPNSGPLIREHYMSAND